MRSASRLPGSRFLPLGADTAVTNGNIAVTVNATEEDYDSQGAATNDTVDGPNGNSDDTLYGGAGNDTLNGKQGDDEL